MKTSTLFVGAVVAQLASAHYFFDTTIRGGTADPSWKYVRSFTRAIAYNPIKFSSNPAADIRDGSTIDGPDARCNQGAFASAGKTEVLTVNAGDEVKVRLGVNAKMEHPGPSLVYMSRAPNDNVKAYDGSGDFFKISQEGVCHQGADFTRDAWCSWGLNTISAKIPLDTPAGEYLIRFEHIGVHRSHVNQPEHFVSCVQARVVNNGASGTPGPLVKFPGAYKSSDAYANFNIYNGYKEFPFPGPAVWTGGNSGGAGVGGGNSSNSSPTPTLPSPSPSATTTLVASVTSSATRTTSATSSGTRTAAAAAVSTSTTTKCAKKNKKSRAQRRHHVQRT
jgi:hypothetical protein